jgi:hypothetical protein
MRRPQNRNRKQNLRGLMMNQSESVTEMKADNVTFLEFLPGLFRFIRLMPRVAKAIKKAKGMA